MRSGLRRAVGHVGDDGGAVVVVEEGDDDDDLFRVVSHRCVEQGDVDVADQARVTQATNPGGTVGYGTPLTVWCTVSLNGGVLADRRTAFGVA
jgi:hypothetical protein